MSVLSLRVSEIYEPNAILSEIPMSQIFPRMAAYSSSLGSIWYSDPVESVKSWLYFAYRIDDIA